MPNSINDMINQLEEIVEKDTFNLTRHDQTAIVTKIEELKQFMQETYGQHKRI